MTPKCWSNLVVLYRACSKRAAALHRSQDGMLTMVAAVAVLFFAVLAAMVLNVGQAVRQKIAVQNAADASAASAAAVMARGMNSITAVNHLIGEVTALCILHEALGGPEMDEGVEENTNESRSIDLVLKVATPAEAEVTKSLTGFLGHFDVDAADALSNLDDGHAAWATIYDSRMHLKRWLDFAVKLRVVANILTVIPFTTYAGYALHGGCEIIIDVVYVQTKILDVIEQGAQTLSQAKLGLESTVLPALAAYAEYGAKEAPRAAAEAARRAGELNGVATFLYPEEFTLPVEPQEYRDVSTGGSRPRAYLRNENPILGDKLSALKEAMDPALTIIEWAQGIVDAIPLLSTVSDKIKEVADINVPSFGSLLDPKESSEENLSIKRIVKLTDPSWTELRYGQWVRASYPHVTAWRTPIRESFGGILSFSFASKWYSHWTNRYTLIKAYKYSIGEYGTAKSGPKLQMYVMSDPEQNGKGFERWTTDNADAERRFTIVAYAHRTPPAPIATFLFGDGPDGGIVAYSQAIFYNGNPQRPRAPADGAAIQPDVGWDTLNWQSPAGSASAYEFLHGDEGGFSLMPPPFPFITFSRAPTSPFVSLNWQAKLTPVTRLEESWSSTPSAMNGVLQRAHNGSGPFRSH